MRVLVTGGTGFVGRHSLALLVEQGYEVHAVARTPPAEVQHGVVWHRGDLLDGAETVALLETVRPTHLLHFAWFAVPGRYWTDAENVRWVTATLHLFDRFAAAGGRRAVLAGSCAEYDLNHGYCSEDRTPTTPDTLYGECKNAVRAVTARAADVLGLTTAWGRIFFVYGPDEHPARLVAYVTNSLLVATPALCSDGAQIRDFLHVADVASAFVALLATDVCGAVNIGSGNPVSIRSVCLRIGELVGRPELIRFGAVEGRQGEPPLVVADVRRLSGEVRWVPTMALDDGLEHTVAWWRRASGPPV